MADRQREAINKRKQIKASRRNKEKAFNIYIVFVKKWPNNRSNAINRIVDRVRSVMSKYTDESTN